jgi:hypothetical protein
MIVPPGFRAQIELEVEKRSFLRVTAMWDFAAQWSNVDYREV